MENRQAYQIWNIKEELQLSKFCLICGCAYGWLITYQLRKISASKLVCILYFICFSFSNTSFLNNYIKAKLTSSSYFVVYLYMGTRKLKKNTYKINKKCLLIIIINHVRKSNLPIKHFSYFFYNQFHSVNHLIYLMLKKIENVCLICWFY